MAKVLASLERAALLVGVIISLKCLSDTSGHTGQFVLASFFFFPFHIIFRHSLAIAEQTEIKSILPYSSLPFISRADKKK